MTRVRWLESAARTCRDSAAIMLFLVCCYAGRVGGWADPNMNDWQPSVLGVDPSEDGHGWYCLMLVLSLTAPHASGCYRWINRMRRRRSRPIFRDFSGILVIRLLDGTRRVIQLMARKKFDFYNNCTLLTIDWINRAAEAARRLEHSAARAYELSKRFLRRFWVTVTPRVRLLTTQSPGCTTGSAHSSRHHSRPHQCVRSLTSWVSQSTMRYWLALLR